MNTEPPDFSHLEPLLSPEDYQRELENAENEIRRNKGWFGSSKSLTIASIILYISIFITIIDVLNPVKVEGDFVSPFLKIIAKLVFISSVVYAGLSSIVFGRKLREARRME